MKNNNVATLLVQNETFLKQMALQFSRNAQDADDLHQETICKALENQQKFTEDSNIQAWLYVIMRNTFINIYRRKKKSFQPIYTNVESLAVVNQLDRSYSINIYHAAICYKIDRLPNKLKIPFKLHIEGYKYIEIADLTGEPVGTVKSHIYFARRLLQGLVERT
jgi:RNA polymerase sigma factor (sigma-70 family)